MNSLRVAVTRLGAATSRHRASFPSPTPLITHFLPHNNNNNIHYNHNSRAFRFSTTAETSSTSPPPPPPQFPPTPKRLISEEEKEQMYQKLQELAQQDVTTMTDQELLNTTDIPGWHLIHSPPRKFPSKSLVGIVVSTKMQKTVNVSVDRYKIVPKFNKRVRYTRKFMAHDETEVANTGDLVLIQPCHKISKNKHFMLIEIIRAKGQV